MVLHLLHELSNIVERSTDADSTLYLALQCLERHLHPTQAFIVLTTQQHDAGRIHCAIGLTETEQARGYYGYGEGITGQVIASGKAISVADVATDPHFLNRTRSRNIRKDHGSFLCVPLRLNDHVVGALAVGYGVDNKTPFGDMDELERLLQIVAAILAHTADLCHKKTDGITEPTISKSIRPKHFVGNSEVMQHVYEQIAQVAPSSSTVFVQGESGTGKELVARAIHDLSPRHDNAFVTLNCAALPESLIESELFGHERGAFTGATAVRKGRFELADKGTLFLDEVGEMSLLTQAKFLRVLQERRFERLGAMESRQVDVRIVTATNRNLETMVQEGSFRRDLFYRLNVFPIQLPALRERSADILPLAAHFARRFSKLNERDEVGISLTVADMLHRYDWPGNIRELENVIERAVLLVGQEALLLPQHLPPALHGNQHAVVQQPIREEQTPHIGSLNARLEELERACIVDALSRFQGHMGRAAGALGLTERVMALRMKKYNLQYKTFRRDMDKHTKM